MTDRNYGAIRDSEKAVAFIERITNDSTKPIAFDIEAGYVGEDKEGVALQQFHPDYIVVGISFTVSTEWARYIPLAHDDGGNVDDIISVGRALWAMLNTGRGVAHNAAYELKGMSRWFRENFWNDPEIGESVRDSNGFFPILSDSQLQVWLSAEYDPLRIGKDLKSVALDAFGLQMTKFMDLFPAEDSDLGPGTKRGKTKFVRFNTRNSRHPKIINYACEDSVAALLIHEKHNPDWQDQFIYKTEMSLLPVLCEMEMGPVDPETGRAIGNMYFDWASIAKKAEEVSRFSKLMNEEILQTLSERLGRVISINLGSVQQLSKVLYDPAPDGLGLPVKQRSEKTGAPSTADDALRVIAKTDPIIKKILEIRQVNKLFGSYLNKFLVEMNYAGTGYVFPNHNQFGALTGRMSVDQVSYQQWPKPYHFELGDGTNFDLNFRDLFIAPPEHRIVGFDFSQVELRVLAGMAHERAMLEAFGSGVDIHKATASSMMGVPLEDVTKKQRAVGKTLNFAVVYGSGPANIAELLSAQGDPTTKEDAQGMLDKYFAAFSGLRNWMDTRIAEGREQGYVNTLFGRKFTVWEYHDQRDWIRSKGDRMCVNAPVQGGAADYLKIGMVRAQAAIHKAERAGRIPKDSIRLTLTIHDALEFLVHDSVDTQTVIDLINPCVSFPVKGLPVEIRADWHEGFSWGSVVEIKLDDEKKISGYAVEDVDQIFSTIEEAYAYQDKERIKEEPQAQVEVEPELQGHSFVPEEYPGPDKREVKGLDDLLDDPTENSARTTDHSHVDEEEPPWLHGKEWHDENDTPMALVDMAQGVAQNALATITITEMPDEEQWAKFQAWLKTERGGSTKVVLETPEGTLTFDDIYLISPDDQPQLSLILGGASLAFSTESVDGDLVTAGMDL